MVGHLFNDIGPWDTIVQTIKPETVHLYFQRNVHYMPLVVENQLLTPTNLHVLRINKKKPMLCQ